jgi:serine/threonine protein kinase
LFIVYLFISPKVNEHWRVKVCDFGLSRIIVQANATMTACGTPSWTAPEVLRNEKYTTKADVYGFGIVVWEMFARADPFPGMPPFQIVFAVGNQNLRPIIHPSWPSDWVKLITDCWAEDPQLRPTFEQIIIRLETLNTLEDDE